MFTNCFIIYIWKMFKRYHSNFLAASQLKISSNIWFSSALADFVDHLASFHQMHNEAMVIVLINIISVMCENSTVYRANKFGLSMNLYNLVVARSCKIFSRGKIWFFFICSVAYGKSPILDLVRRAIDEVVRHRSSKFKSASNNGGKFDEAVYFDENTSAGLLSSLRGGTRFLITDEADVVLKKMGYTLAPQGSSRDWPTNDCRSQLLSLYDRPHNFTRKLKHETVQVFDAKLNILVSILLGLLKSFWLFVVYRGQYQAIWWLLFYFGNHLVLWLMRCLNARWFGHLTMTLYRLPPASNRLIQGNMSIEQFAIVASFIENINLYFEEKANEQMIMWCDDLKTKSKIFLTI